MDVNLIHINTTKKIKFSLVFFCLTLLLSCNQKVENPRFRIDYDNQKATRIVFQSNDAAKNYKVRLKGSSNSIFGRFTSEDNDLIFSPIIPFTGGETYEVYTENKVYLEFSVPRAENQIRPRLLGIYPKLDTVPENLLKMYLVFDKPMQQSQSTLDFIKVFNQTTGKEVEVFLPLENELWNADKTELTLWLDPGRIKKDLIPNQEKGIPIEKGNQYEMVIENGLRDTDGTDLGKVYTKRFFVAERDQQSPNVKNWELTIPSPKSKEGLGIRFDESLSFLLISDMIQIYDAQKQLIEGEYLTSKKATNTLFVPMNSWEKGKYTIVIDSKLDDLAGNNLNRLFDVDLEKSIKTDTSEVKKLTFNVQ